MRFLADMGASPRIAEDLRASGHDVVHLRELGLQKLPDGDIFRRAAAERRVVLTFDLDFGEIAAHCPGLWASVILFRLVDTRTDHVIDRLRVALAATAVALERGAVVVVEEGRCRVRSLPFGPPDVGEPPAVGS